MNIQYLDFEEFLNRIDNLNFIGIAIDLKTYLLASSLARVLFSVISALFMM